MSFSFETDNYSLFLKVVSNSDQQLPRFYKLTKNSQFCVRAEKSFLLTQSLI